MVALTQPLTLDEFLLRPEEKPALEYERGVITQKMSPMPKHGKVPPQSSTAGRVA